MVQKFSIRITTVWLVLALFPDLLFSAGLKKVLVLDFINIDQRPNYNYLENSITDAIRNSLGARFAFQETPRKKIEAVAAENYIYRNDFYTKTASMNLGLLAKQDIVISGGFRIQEEKKKKKIKSILYATVRLLDINNRKTISEFTIKANVDNTIFQTVDKIAKRISREARAVLPSKEEWARMGLTTEPGLEHYNQLTLYGGYHAWVLPSSNQNLETNGFMSPSMFDKYPSFGIEFQRYGIILNEIGFWGGFEYRIGSANLQVLSLNETVPATYGEVSAMAGVSYRYFIIPELYAQTAIGGGYARNTMTLKYTGSNVIATTPSGEKEALTELTVLSPVFKAGLRAGYVVLPWLALELGIQYQRLFFSNGSSDTLGGEFRFGFLL